MISRWREVRTFYAGGLVSKRAGELARPAPVFLVGGVDDAHAAADFAFYGAHAAAVALDVVRDYVCPALDPPLRPNFLAPPHCLDGSSAPATLCLRLLVCVSGTRLEDLTDLLHAHVCGEGWEIAFVDARVLGSLVVLVLWELCPEAAEDAVAGSGDIGSGRAWRCGGERAEDELGRLHLGEMGAEELLPWCGGENRGRWRSVRHCLEEAREPAGG